jgi:threonylcarbamoyladenosine tRNA methylthiotransferase MtaB
MTTYRTVTLGCKVNQYETREIETVLDRCGALCADEGIAADLVIVNTCVVTAEAARQCRQAIRRQRRENPSSRLIVTGCYVTGPERDGLDGVEGITLIVGDKDALRRRLAEELAPGADVSTCGIDRFGDHARAFVKIQDGCDQYCSYCIVAHARPQLKSRAADEVLDEVRRLSRAGHAEIVLSGIHLGKYGAEGGEADALARLVERLVDLPELGRLRLSSIEVGEVSARLLALMADRADRICGQLHLPLQSGDDGVLAAMRRPYTSGEFLSAVERARSALPQMAVTSDVIVGFPGESESALERSCDVIRRAGISRLHVFPYSPRSGTPAATMPDQIAPDVKRRRATAMRELGHRLATEFAASLVGREVTVLVEKTSDDADGTLAEGFDEHYVRTQVRLASPRAAQRGALLPARAIASDGGTLQARSRGACDHGTKHVL